MNLFTLDICHSVEYTPTGINFMLFASLILDFWGVLNVNLEFAKLYPVGIQLLTVAAFSLIASFFFLVIIIYLMCKNSV